MGIENVLLWFCLFIGSKVAVHSHWARPDCAHGITHCPFEAKELFFISQKDANWFQAQLDCASRGMRLVTMMDENKAKDLKKALHGDSREIWIGLSDIAEEGKFKWVNGRSIAYSEWDSGQPDNHGGNEHCVHVYPTRTWNDRPCMEKHPYICEYY